MMKFLVDRPIGVILSYVALVLLGITAYAYLPVSLMPDLDIPMITVQVKQADASAEEIEQHITSHLRERLRQLNGLEDISSSTQEGSTLIRLTFTHGTNINLSFIEVNEKIDLSMNELPGDVARPQVIKASSTDIPAFFCNIRLKEQHDPAAFSSLSDLAEKVIKRRIEQLPEVAMTDMTGLDRSRILIIPDEYKLQSLGVSNANIQQLLHESNLQLGNIEVKDGQYQYFLRFTNNLFNPEDVGNILLNLKGRLFKLKDLATIKLQQVPATGAFYAGNERAVNLAVIKHAAARMDDLQHDFRALLDVMRRDYPDLIFDISQDQSTLLDYAVSNLQQDLLLGGVLAIVLVLLFIKRVQLALLIGLVIPVSLILCQLVFYLAHVSVNIISLSGLILGLGMIIDNSIVVIDNITQYTDEGMPLNEACATGTGEVAKPLFTSLLTNCAIFLPLIFLSGIAGALFYEQAISMATGIFISMLVSLTLLPVLYRLMKVSRRTVTRSVYLDRLYEAGLQFAMRRPLLLLTINILLIIAAVAAFNRMPKERFPDMKANNTEMSIDWNEDISFDENNKRVKELLQQAGQSANSWIGQQQYLVNRNYDLDITQSKLYIETNQLRSMQQGLSGYINKNWPAASVRFAPAATPLEQLFGQQQAALTLEISNEDKRLMPAVPEVAGIISEIPGVSAPALRKNLQLHLNYELMALYNISSEHVMNALETRLKFRQIDEVQGSAAMIPVVIGADRQFSLEGLFVSNSAGQSIPLASLISFSTAYDYKYISGGIQGLYYPVNVSAIPVRQLESLIKKHPEQSLKLSGSYFYNQQLIKELGMILLISVLLLYFILAAQFESLLQPLIILAELPVDIAGAVLLLYITGAGINLMSMIGLIVMCGIIINDSILKIDAINQLIKTGVELDLAIHTAGKKRLHSIVMITLTTTGTLFPTLFMHDPGSVLQQPLVLALIGGMVPGMFVSLFVIPILYRFLYRKKTIQPYEIISI